MGNTEDIETSTQPAEVRSSSRQNGSSLKGVEASVGREQLSSVVPPDDLYEGKHRWDPAAEWSKKEERSVVWKTDIRLMSWLCVMFFALQLDRGNLANALADDFLDDMGFTSDIYNNGTTIQLVAFLSAEFPAQYLAKRYGFRIIMPSMMFAWGAVTAFQAFMNDLASFYITRALIGFFEGGFIPAAASSIILRPQKTRKSLLTHGVEDFVRDVFLHVEGVGGAPGGVLEHPKRGPCHLCPSCCWNS